MMFDRPDADRLRRRTARREPWRNVAMLSDDELFDEWLRTEEPWWERATYGGTAYGKPTEASEPAAEDLAPAHFIEFEVQDGNGDPYPGLGYVLDGPDGEMEEGTVSGPIRRDKVPSEDYRLTIKTVDELVWGAATAASGEVIELRGRVSGHADGTEVVIRIFRELRETDDDVIDTVTATVEDGQVVASWTYDPSTIAGSHAQLRFIAELSVPDVQGWAKTATPVVIELPAIRVARWSNRRIAPGKPVNIRVQVAGIADGSPITVEVFKQRRDGAQECLDTFEGLAVTDGAVVLSWTFASDPDDPLAPNEAECFFVATSEVYLDATRTSGPLWISRAVGRRSRARGGKGGVHLRR